MKTQVWLAFSFGVVFLLIAVVFALVAFYLPKPENPDVVANFLNVMQVVLAISSSGVAAVIPGFLNVRIQAKLGQQGTTAIRAGGALAVFALVYLIGPKSLALDQLNQRVGYNENLEQCMSLVPAFGSPMTGAIGSCLQVARINPNRWEAHRQIGRIYFWNMQYEGAIASYKKAIGLRAGRNFDEIKRKDQIADDFQRDFSAMCWSVAMAYVGMANDTIEDVDKKLAAYRTSLAIGEMSAWFAGRSDETADLAKQLVFLSAVNHAYIWVAANNVSDSSEFELAVSQFERYLTLPNNTPQWAEFHLSCLYATASAALDGTEYKEAAREYLVKALRHLLRNQNDKSIIQRSMMKCRLRDPEACERPRGSEPMICKILFEMFKNDPEIDRLVGSL
jgi:tetratricopeptide (TPR) repeat protein